MATKNVIKEAKQRQFKANPFNRKRGYSRGKLWVSESAGTVMLSSTSLLGSGCFVSVGDKCLVRLEVGDEGNLELTAAIHDKADNLIANIERNEWKTGDPSPWDFISIINI
jgi:hypothetical protein